MNSRELTISVVVPAYNRADLISRSLDSILAQTRPADEIIVVDDGSKDSTPDILRAYEKHGVTTKRIENSADLVARNTGLRMARGDLVAFCDSDDLWRPGHLALIDGLWRQYPDLHAAFTNFVIRQGDTVTAETKFASAPFGFWKNLIRVDEQWGLFPENFVEEIVSFNPFFPSCMAARRSFLLGIGGWYEGVGRSVSKDFATTLLLAEHPPLGVVFTPTVEIRKHDSNYSGDVQAMNLGEAFILEHVLERRPSLEAFRQQIGQSIARRRRDALEIAFSRRDFDAVRKIYELLPKSSTSTKISIKRFVAGMPSPVREGVARLLLAAGSAKRLHGTGQRLASASAGDASVTDPRPGLARD